MLLLDFNAMYEHIQAIDTYSVFLKHKLDELRMITKNLKALSSMNENITSIKGIEMQLEKEILDLQTLSQTLQTILSFYQHCEDNIVKRYDLALTNYQKNETGFMDLSNISSYLKEIYK